MLHNKRNNLKLFCLLAIAVCLSGCGIKTSGGPGSKPVKKSGVLSSDEIWSGRIMIMGDVTVPEGVTLTIQPGTIVGFNADTGKYKLTIDGSLYAEGNKDQRITFASLALETQAEDWIGLIFGKSSLNSRLGFCRFMHHSEILCYSDSLRITDCIFKECKIGVVCERSSPIIENSEFNNNRIGIKCIDGAEPEIRQNLIQANYNGILCEDSSDPSIVKNQIDHNYQHAIVCHSASSPDITSNNIVSNDGWAVYDGGKLSDNFIRGNKKEKLNAIDAGTGRNSTQYYGVDEVREVRKSEVTDAGPQKVSDF